MPSSTVLEVRHLSVDYRAASGAVHAVADVSFTLKRGEVLGLAGESGSGKSTLAYAIARLLRPPAAITGGQALYYPRTSQVSEEAAEPNLIVDGLDLDPGGALNVLALTPAQLRKFRWEKLALVFQSAMNALNPVLTVHAQIDDVLRTHRPGMSAAQRQARATELLRLVGIAPDRLKSYPHELSGGMRQRAVIAIALALNPEVIILDEPTTALDVVVQRDILRALQALRQEFGFAAIFITHDLSLLLEIADEVAVMYAGRIVEQATREALYSRASHPYTLGLMQSFPALHGPRRELTGIPGSPPDLRHVPSGCAFNPRCAYAFSPCKSLLPALRMPEEEAERHTVACHLYDPAVNPAGLPDELRRARAGRTAPGGEQHEPPVTATREGRYD
jgi:peptide/nickel transport system ATP-binding protein